MPPNLPLQARAGQNAPFPWGPYAHTRGRLAESVVVRGDGTDQVLMEGVCLPGIDPGIPTSLGSALGLDATLTVAGGLVTLQDEDGDIWPPFSALAAVPATLVPIPLSGFPFSGSAGSFLVAEGEKIIMQGAVGGGTGKLFPNVGLIPNDPSELKAYRIDLSDGARHLIAQAPPGKALCQVPVAGVGAATPAINYFGIITRNDSSATAPTVQMYLDGIKVGGPQTLGPAAGGYMGVSPIILDPSGRLVLASGSKLEAEVTGLASGARVRWCSSMRMENGS